MQYAVIGIDEEDESTFTISTGNQTYHFQGEVHDNFGCMDTYA